MADAGEGELEVGSFSSGQVAEPLGGASEKNSWLSETLFCEDNEMRLLCEHAFSTFPVESPETCSLGARVSDFMPNQGIAIDALLERKRSQDRMLLVRWGNGPSGLL